MNLYRGKQAYTYDISHWLYGRCLGFVILVAFLSYWWQADALIGPDGLLPFTNDLSNIESWCAQNHNVNKWVLRPTLLWLDSFSNYHSLFLIGSVSSLFLTIGIFPIISALICYICYLSLMVVGEPFLNFQWDALLCETLLLSIPFLPLTKYHKLGKPIEFPVFGRFLIIALLAKLILESGIVKFTSFGTNSENAWRDFTALDYHYWTQPLPHGLSVWIDSLPLWFDHFSLYLMYTIELMLPFFLFLPGMIRRIGLIGQVMLQITILFSGNYGFFNLLTLCLCIPLIDDRIFPRFLANRFKSIVNKNTDRVFENDFFGILRSVRNLFLFIAWIFFGVTTYGHLSDDFRGNKNEPLVSLKSKWTQPFQEMIRPTRAFNSYGLFRVMTKTRPEIIIEGSLDRFNWHTYQFRWKPTAPNQSLGFTGPHMPRIDWQMWFEGLNYEQYANHPFSLMLYHKFIKIISLGESIERFNDFGMVIGQQEYQNFIQAPPDVRKQVLANYNSLLNSFNSRSLWFGELLEAIFEHRHVVMKQLGENLANLPPKPNYLRVSLAHYTFAEPDDEQVWNVSAVDGASLIISKND